MNSIGIICAYFGKLPGCYDAWLKSCEYNQTIDFILVTDQSIDYRPKNVKVINMTFHDVQLLVNKQLKKNVALDFPYKFCDLKPLYGVIFSEYLKQYEYWGHCDMDLVFGDLQYFLEKYDLQSYDKFLDLGHLSIYRNNELSNNRFKEDGSLCGTWEEMISSSRGFAFDERCGIYQIYKKNNYPQFDKRVYADIAIIYRRFRCALDDINYDQQVFYWENGKVYRDYWINNIKHKEEFMYIHFKQRKFKRPDFDLNNSNAFYIGPTGYTDKLSESQIEIVNKINPFHGKTYEKKELLIFKIKDLKRRIMKKTNNLIKKEGID